MRAHVRSARFGQKNGNRGSQGGSLHGRSLIKPRRFVVLLVIAIICAIAVSYRVVPTPTGPIYSPLQLGRELLYHPHAWAGTWFGCAHSAHCRQGSVPRSVSRAAAAKTTSNSIRIVRSACGAGRDLWCRWRPPTPGTSRCSGRVKSPRPSRRCSGSTAASKTSIACTSRHILNGCHWPYLFLPKIPAVARRQAAATGVRSTLKPSCSKRRT